MSATIATHIEETPGVCGGKPRIAGTRIRVQDIVVWTEQGQSPDEIVAGYPHLTLADVYAALAYYHDNRDKIDRQLRESEQFIAALQAQAMTRQPRITDADGDPVSS
jgi:uncharacterized protein (DUF433 family)